LVAIFLFLVVSFSLSVWSLAADRSVHLIASVPAQLLVRQRLQQRAAEATTERVERALLKAICGEPMR
jgi:hypothetical protein